MRWTFGPDAGVQTRCPVLLHTAEKAEVPGICLVPPRGFVSTARSAGRIEQSDHPAGRTTSTDLVHRARRHVRLLNQPRDARPQLAGQHHRTRRPVQRRRELQRHQTNRRPRIRLLVMEAVEQRIHGALHRPGLTIHPDSLGRVTIRARRRTLPARIAAPPPRTPALIRRQLSTAPVTDHHGPLSGRFRKRPAVRSRKRRGRAFRCCRRCEKSGRSPGLLGVDGVLEVFDEVVFFADDVGDGAEDGEP